MNHSPFWPLVWKEYRASRAFWLAMAVIGLISQFCALWLTRRPIDRDWWLYGLALMVSAGFAVGVGGTLFATEHEDRTFGLLRTLPLRARELGGAKLLSALVGIVSLVAALWLTASLLAGLRGLSLDAASQLWGLWGLACAEGLAWGVLFSLATHSPLRATLLTLITVTLVNEVCVTFTQTHDVGLAVSYVEAIPFRLTILLLIVAADLWLLPRWLTGQSLGRPKRESRAQAVAPMDRQLPARTWRESRHEVSHLIWQSWREARSFGWLVLVLGPLFLFAFRPVHGSVAGLATFIAWPETWHLLGFFPAALVSALLGALVFHADQLHSPRFLAERGVSARWVWLSRELAGIGWLVVWGLVLVVLPVFQLSPNRWMAERLAFHLQDCPLLLEILFCGFAAGQLVSLAVRRGVVAAVLASTLGTIVALWAGVMLLFEIGAWWSVLPIPLAMLLATWLRAPDWLLGRGGWQRWFWPLAVVAVPSALVALEVPRWRENQIPLACAADQADLLSRLGATHSPQRTAEAQVTFDLYAHARELFSKAPAGSVFDARNETLHVETADDPAVQEIAQVLLEAAGRPYNLGALSVEQRFDLTNLGYHLGEFLLATAETLETDGRFDPALDLLLASLRREAQLEPCRFIKPRPAENPDVPYALPLAALRDWAGAKGQTAERILAAIKRLEDWHAGLPPAGGRLLMMYENVRGAIDEEAFPFAYRTEQAEVARRLPSERQRARRLLDLITVEQIRNTESLQADLVANRQAQPIPSARVARVQKNGRPQNIGGWLGTTPLVRPQLADFSLPWYVLARETDYRATLIILALEAWKIEHGELPNSLDQLKDVGLDPVPLDPAWAYPFLYYPTGVPAMPRPAGAPAPEPKDEVDRRGSNPARGWHYAEFMNGFPFLWSALNRQSYQNEVSLMQWGRSEVEYVRQCAGCGDGFRTGNAVDVLEAGYFYAIP